MLNYWEKDFDTAIDKHIDFLKQNLEFQKKNSHHLILVYWKKI